MNTMPPVESSEKATEHTLVESGGDGNTEVESKKFKEIIETLNSIKSELAIQSQQLAVLADNSTRNPLPDIPPDKQDWSDEVHERWLQCRVPTPEKLERLRGVFFDLLKHCKDEVEISIPTSSASLGMSRRLDPSNEQRRLSISDKSLEYLLDIWPRSMTGEPNRPPCSVGFSEEKELWKAFDWIFPDDGNGCPVVLVKTYDIGYNKQGYPELGASRNDEDGRLPENLTRRRRRSYISESPWTGNVCGRVIKARVNNLTVLSPATISYILWQLHGRHAMSFNFVWEPPGAQFVLAFASQWGICRNSACNAHMPTDTVSLRFQIRWMGIFEYPPGNTGNMNGICLNWGRGDIPDLVSGTVKDLHLAEIRHAFAIHSTTSLRLPLFTMVYLFDNNHEHDMEYYYLNLDMVPAIERSKLGACRAGPLTGIWVFLVEISISLGRIVERWTLSLDRLDKATVMSLAELTRSKRQKLMFDNDQFSRSDQYFAVLQILPICTSWIKEITQGLADMHRDLSNTTLAGRVFLEDEAIELRTGQQCLDAMFSHIISDAEAMLQPLLNRIERKIEEVKGLRDGLFNATSVKEASKGTALAENSARQNRYILVFAVATIFYLPMGFVTSFFGMHLFDPNDTASASRTPFIITFVVLSLGTYILAASGLLFVRDWVFIKDWLSGWYRREPSKVLPC